MVDAEGMGHGVGATITLLGQALAIGLLVGLERGWVTRNERAGTRVAGLRTFALLGLTGGVAGLIPGVAAAAVLVIAGAIIIAGYIRQSEAAASATTAVAALLVLALGALATHGYAVEALAAAATATLLLSLRAPLHGLVRGLSAAELRAAARFAILALVLLPIVPDRPLGPYGAWNPHQLVLVVVLVAGLSFAGYVLSRRARATRSILLVAGFGAIVSSTAATAALARRIDGTGAPAPLAAGIALASAISVARVGLLVALLEPGVLLPVMLVLGPALLVLLAAVAWSLRAAGTATTSAIPLGNPLDLLPALGLALLVALTSVASRWALASFGDIGVAGVLAIIGLADVDAAVLAFSAMPSDALSGRMAGVVLAAPVLLNLLLKSGLTIALAPSRAAVQVAAPLVVAAVMIGAAIIIALSP